MNRRQTFKTLAVAAASTVPGWARADSTYPERAVRWVIPYTAGGPTDVMARIISEVIGTHLNGHRPMIENRPGGSSVIGTLAVYNAKPDGYTMGSMGDLFGINELLLPNIPYKFTEFEFVRGLVTIPVVIAVPPEMPVASLDDLLEHFRKNGNSLSFGTWGFGSSAHLLGELIGEACGVKFTHVPYPGSAPAINALLGKHVNFVVLDLASVQPFAQAGKVKIAAVATGKRQPSWPDVPALSERLPNIDSFAWNGVIVPKGTPKFIVEKLSNAFHATLLQVELRRNLASRGMMVWDMEPAQLLERVKKENRDAAGIVTRRKIVAG